MNSNFTAEDVKIKLSECASDYDAVSLQRFFKTGPGEYGEGDVFIGVKMGPIRAIAKEYKYLEIAELGELVGSPIHEHRMCSLIILTNQYKTADNRQKSKLYDFYIKALNNGHINNWDLIDVTCEHVVGEYLRNKPKKPLYELAKSQSLWHRRVAIISTFAFIKSGDVHETIKIANMLLKDEQDLIHKAVGWMLREVGKRVDEQILCQYLDQHAHEMPRIMLRYAIEKLSVKTRSYYMSR